jgi:class 3 adenylate cyclase
MLDASTCPRCMATNPATHGFCESCGARLEATCPGCGTAVRLGARFCGGCGAGLGEAPRASQRPTPVSYTPKHLAEKILGSRATLEGERKQVTVLFADVKGSMELAEQLDAEEWHKIMDRFFQILTDGVHRFEGTVNQFTGDGIMALFGAPIAHEDHAQRACWAALHLRGTLRTYADQLRVEHGLSFAVRMGLNSGEVVVGRIGDDLRMDYTAQGHTVGLAQRMEQLAEPGKALLTEHTARLVQGLFALRDLGPARVKGATAPVRLHELLEVGPMRTRLDVSRARGFSRFVGRTDELTGVEAALARALDGDGRVVGVVGEPGVGKSRLCDELVERARARGITVHTARAVAHGATIPFLPVLELLRGIVGITADDDDEAARRKIAGTAVRLDPALTDALPLLFDLLGVADPADPLPRMDPETRQERVAAMLKRLVRARSRREAVVILFEDLHWIDAASAVFLEDLVEAVVGTRTLLLVNFRPEYGTPWKERPYYEEIALVPLGPAAIAELLGDLLGSDPSLPDLAERIRVHTGGNPFFIEETVAALAEAGTLVGAKGAYRLAGSTAELVLPATVHAVLAARIDRLGEREKHVLQTAAVIGKDFAAPLLRDVVGLPEPDLAAALDRLTRAELVHETALYPAAEYAFKHPLTQEVAYRSQLGDRRARVHAAVAHAIEAGSADRLDERAALLAYHWEHAGEAWVAAGWHRRAAEWVGGRDRRETLRHWIQVRALLAKVPESDASAELGCLARTGLLGNASLLGHAEVDAQTVFAEGMRLAERLETPALRIVLLTRMAYARITAGAVEEALTYSGEAVRLADASGDETLPLLARMDRYLALWNAGRLRESLAMIQVCEAMATRHPERRLVGGLSINPLGMLPAHHASLLVEMGGLREAALTMDAAMQVGRTRKDPEVLTLAHLAGADLHRMIGDAELALRHARQAVEFADAGGIIVLRVAAFYFLGGAQLLRRDWRGALDSLSIAHRLVGERRLALEWEPDTLSRMAEASVGLGDLGRGCETADRALALACQRRLPLAEIVARLSWARVRLATEGAAAAPVIEACLADAAALVNLTEARVHEPFIHVERAALARLEGDQVGWQRELAQARRLFEGMGATVRAEQVVREMAS